MSIYPRTITPIPTPAPAPTALFTGTLPLFPFAERFYGVVSHDGQMPRVAALVCDDDTTLVMVSLVGYDTSNSAALAALWNNQSVAYLPPADCRWRGPKYLARKDTHYTQFTTRLAGTHECNTVALNSAAHIGYGILNPPDLPDEPDASPDSRLMQENHRRRQMIDAMKNSRFVLGNWQEDMPHVRSFLGQLYAMRVVFLHNDDMNPQYPLVWAEQMWLAGLRRQLIVPLENTMGIKCWRLSANLADWAAFIGEGVRQGWLPVSRTLAPEPEPEPNAR